jgi:putative membrane protein
MMWGWGGVFFVICIVMMVWVMAGHGSRGHTEQGEAGTNGSGPTALQILAERFARGEISEEEFEQRKRVLEGHLS